MEDPETITSVNWQVEHQIHEQWHYSVVWGIGDREQFCEALGSI